MFEDLEISRSPLDSAKRKAALMSDSIISGDMEPQVPRGA
jgi:hypothetical protein